MGRKSRNTAKTGDVAIYKSRDDEISSSNKKKDDDNMYNEVDRFHNANNDLQDDMLKFDTNDSSDDDDLDDQVNQKENVFDLGLDDDDSSEDDDDTDNSDNSDTDDGSVGNVKQTRNARNSDETPSESDDDDDSSMDDFEIPETDVLNWGKRKKDYYHGDTADLEIGQEVEDAELEEEAGREVLKTRMEGMTEDDFMLDDDDDDDGSESDQSDIDPKGDKGKSNTLSSAITSTMQKNLSKLSKKEKIKLMQKTHPELLPLLSHFREQCIRPCVDETLVVTNAMFQSKDNAEVRQPTKSFSFHKKSIHDSLEWTLE
jgi:U3 small nucleolar RNA-associated protein 3